MRERVFGSFHPDARSKAGKPMINRLEINRKEGRS